MDAIVSISDGKEQIKALENLVNGIFASKRLDNMSNIIIRLTTSGQFSQQVVKPILIHISQQFMNAIAYEGFEDMANNFILTIKQQQGGSSHDEADYMAREALFQYYLAVNLFKDAALILAGVNIDSTSYVLSNAQKVDLYLKCAECCLADNETVDAEVFVNKASPYMNDIADRQLQLRYRATSARVLDSNRKFIEAAERYYELASATDTGVQVHQDDLLELLGKAITCAILAKAGPRRSRILKQLSKDDKLSQLESSSSYYATLTVILAKMNYDQLLSKEELMSFTASLQPHQKALMSDGFTIPEKAIMEHNLTAVGRLYHTINITELSTLLGLQAQRVEKVMAKMITEDRLKACIDQTSNMLMFMYDAQSQAYDHHDAYDGHIRDICDNITACAERVKMLS